MGRGLGEARVGLVPVPGVGLVLGLGLGSAVGRRVGAKFRGWGGWLYMEEPWSLAVGVGCGVVLSPCCDGVLAVTGAGALSGLPY